MRNGSSFQYIGKRQNSSLQFIEKGKKKESSFIPTKVKYITDMPWEKKDKQVYFQLESINTTKSHQFIKYTF